LPDELWEKGEKLWLIHRAGIASCRILPKDAPTGNLMDGKTKVRLEQDGSVLIVDEAATEPANHPEQGTGRNKMSKFQNCTLHLRLIGDRNVN
jgi:hypothetical protein